MTDRRKKRPGGYRNTGARVTEASRDVERSSGQVPRFLGWLSRPTGDTPWPSIPSALGRGFVTVGSSVPLLLGTFVLLLVMWLGLVLVGSKGPAGQLANLLALPPVSTYFDATNAVTIFGFGPTGILASLGFIVVRSFVLALIGGLVVRELLEEGGVGDGLRRGLRAFAVVLAANMATFSLMILGSLVLPFLGPGLGFLGSILILVAALFLFAFAPAAGAWETGRPLVDVLRRASRAALLPGSRHLLMCLLYIFLTLPILLALAPGGSLRSVNPSATLWAYSLLTTFIHMSFLAAFSYRYLAVYDEIPDEPLKLRRR